MNKKYILFITFLVVLVFLASSVIGILMNGATMNRVKKSVYFSSNNSKQGKKSEEKIAGKIALISNAKK